MRGLTFKNAATNVLQLVGATLSLAGANLWEDLFFDTGGATAVNVMSLSGSGTIYGTYRRLRTLGARVIGGNSGITIDAATLFEDCIAGNQSLGGGTIVSGPGLFSGTLCRCILNGATWHGQVQAVGVVEDCTFNACAIQRLVTGATIRRTTILPTSGTCLGNATDTAAIKSYRNNLRLIRRRNGLRSQHHQQRRNRCRSTKHHPRRIVKSRPFQKNLSNDSHPRR